VVADTRIVPDMAALDPELMTGLPPDVTAATGMDALTHAVEAFIGDWATPHTDRLALAAVKMVWDHLPQAFSHGGDLVARERMALASTYAGMAFTRANVGNVHAIAHQLGATYHTPHGLANAMLLPHVLRFSLPAARKRLALLARAVGLRAAATLNWPRPSATRCGRSTTAWPFRAGCRPCRRPTSRRWPRRPATRPTSTTRCRAACRRTTASGCCANCCPRRRPPRARWRASWHPNGTRLDAHHFDLLHAGRHLHEGRQPGHHRGAGDAVGRVGLHQLDVQDGGVAAQAHTGDGGRLARC
jgi:hypothetical protein